MSITINGSGDINATGNDIELNSTGTTDVTLALGGGNVGIGTAIPSSLLDVDKSQDAETNIEITNTNAGSAAQVRTKYTTDGGLFTVGKTSDAHPYGGDAYIYNVDNTNIRFATNDTERLRILSTGGITFNGDTAAANALSDYEEGTWTPTLLGQSSNPTVTYALQSGYYTKIGNTVNLFCRLQTSARSGGSGTALVGGLPFAHHSAARAGGGVGYVSGVNLGTGYTQFGLSGDVNTSTIRYVQSGDNIGSNIIDVIDVPASGNHDVVFTYTYQTT